MINYNKNELINICLDTYYETFRHTLDTLDYVPEKYNKKILRYIFKNMKKQFKKLDKEDKYYQRGLKKFVKKQAKNLSTGLDESANGNPSDNRRDVDEEKEQIILQLITLIKAIKKQKESSCTNEFKS